MTPAISLDKIQQQAPALVSMVKTAAVSLDKQGLTGQRAAVYLVLDHSGSMVPFYRAGDVQHLAEQALGLSVNLDDDGSVPVFFFSARAESPFDVDLGNYQGIIDREHAHTRWGSTNYEAAITAVVSDYQASGATDPALVIFQSDGEPDSRKDAEMALKAASKLPLFWAFIGFGEWVEFLEKLDDLRGRAVDNASFYGCGNRPQAISDASLYDGITHEFASWLTAARAKGIVTS